MSSTNILNSSESENACVVCFKNVDLFSVGVCDHPVCFECSTRMRVLCNQIECPICRQEMPRVIFTKEVEPYHSLKPKVERLNLQDRKYGLYFHSQSIQNRYFRLLEHECFICKRNGCSTFFKTFKQLKDHMRRIHELLYCELCVNNLKIFTFERRCYTRTELATHRRKGDADNTSHRGHPLCEFCETRFMDNDELFRHLRRDHLFCHFCDADGKHQYYSSYNDLRKHYSEEHYLCEEGECKDEKFTSVFRSDIDLKAHYAAFHSRNLSKAATRQARTLELEFTLAPRPRPESIRGGRNFNNNRYPESARHEEEGAVGYDTYCLEPGGPGGGYTEPKVFNPLAAENFPSLNGDTSNTPSRTVSNLTITSKLNPLSQDNFPSLGGNNSAPPRSSAVTITSKFNSNNSENTSRQQAVSITRGVPKRNSINYPALVESASANGSIKVNLNSNAQDRIRPKSSNVSIHVNHKASGAVTTHISQGGNGQTVAVRPTSMVDAFPALNSEPIPQAQWVSQKQKKQEPIPSKIAPAPSLPPNTLNDFPTLSKGGKTDARKSITAWVNLNNFNSDIKNNNNSKQKQEKNKDNKNIAKIAKQEVKSVKPSETTTTDSLKTKKKKSKGPNLSVEELTNNTDRNLTLDESDNKKQSARDEPKSNIQQNGITKKRSELNMEVSEPLVHTGLVEGAPSVSRPPPGFSLKPPPGFHRFPLSNNALPNDLTFTSSSGQSYSIIPRQQFFHPPNFKIRNQILIEKFMAVLKNSDEIQQFKVYSDMFRAGEILADNYYDHCQQFMGSEFNKLFPELLVLLPDVQKQQDLYKIHKGFVKAKGLEVCAICEQVVLKGDLRNHLANHALESHFPVLNQPVTSNNVWNKK
ncbi:hypothetical protein FQR65_LT11508 [Abscondita terminalis]|nr:hypothetical protein FQR65_LT11508 [Abscondita terminalis]